MYTVYTIQLKFMYIFMKACHAREQIKTNGIVEVVILTFKALIDSQHQYMCLITQKKAFHLKSCH